jgi:hypothetical protein
MLSTKSFYHGGHGVARGVLFSVPLVSAVVVTRLQGLQVRAYSFLYHFRRELQEKANVVTN